MSLPPYTIGLEPGLWITARVDAALGVKVGCGQYAREREVNVRSSVAMERREDQEAAIVLAGEMARERCFRLAKLWIVLGVGLIVGASGKSSDSLSASQLAGAGSLAGSGGFAVLCPAT